MSTIQNLKNFIRHGKQARGSAAPHAEPTTILSPVTAHQQNQGNDDNGAASRQQGQYGLSEPNTLIDANFQPASNAAAYSAANVDNRNVAAKAGATTARAAGEQQVLGASTKKYDENMIEKIVAEERANTGKLPKYPGLEKWTLLEKMGDGAFSNVYRAKDNAGLLGEVAIKVVRRFELNQNQGDKHLHPDFKKQPKVVERSNILKEVSIMRQLDHPNIVKLIDFSESPQFYYIILELCPGGELFHQIVRLTFFSEELSRHVIVQVAKALRYLHEEKGVVHRDIKPENLLFYPIPFVPSKNPKPRSAEDEDKADEGEFVRGVGGGGIGRIKIADFGLSKVVWDTQTMTPCGTVGYTAPEIVKDERYSKSVDMWALGCVLYTLLCGFPPFYDESIQVLTEKVARGQYTFLSPWWDDISKSAQDLVSHLLTVDPETRYTIDEFLQHPWIRESQDATRAAADAPPLATPAVERQNQLGYSMPHDLLPPTMPETPGARRMDFRSPGAINLREVFDVSYAVHRQEEETKRRKNFPQGYRGAAAMGGLNALDEDEDSYDNGFAPSQPYDPIAQTKLPKSGMRESEVSNMEQTLKNTNLGSKASATSQLRQQPAAKGYGQHSPAIAAAAKSQMKPRRGAFELSLDNATLLGRRGKKQDPSSLREQLVL